MPLLVFLFIGGQDRVVSRLLGCGVCYSFGLGKIKTSVFDTKSETELFSFVDKAATVAWMFFGYAHRECDCSHPGDCGLTYL